MNTEQFTANVRERAGDVDEDFARRTVEVVLTVLSERDLKGEAANLGARLPGESKRLMTDHGAAGDEKFGRNEFLRRVSERLGVDDASAASASRAVLSTAAAAVSDGQHGDFLKRLRRDLEVYARPHT